MISLTNLFSFRDSLSGHREADDDPATNDYASNVPDGLFAIIGNYLNPFNPELATASLSTFLRKEIGADILGNRPP